MDLLADILNLAGIEKSILGHHSIYRAWAMRFPCEKSMGFHVITQGELYIRSSGLKTPIKLSKGDIILIARGFDHEVATDLKVKSLKTIDPGDRNLAIPGQLPIVTFASGAYRFRETPNHPVLTSMPAYIFIQASDIPSHDPLHSALQLLSAELAMSELGSEVVTRNLLDILFHYILRRWMSSPEKNHTCWSTALKDPNLTKALKAIHENPENDWTVESLASVSGLSRASFAQKFKKFIGDTPAHYLAKVRIQKAAQYFRTGSFNVEEVAEAVGYHDAFVFSKVFKRIRGISPREYKTSLPEAK